MNDAVHRLRPALGVLAASVLIAAACSSSPHSSTSPGPGTFGSAGNAPTSVGRPGSTLGSSHLTVPAPGSQGVRPGRQGSLPLVPNPNSSGQTSTGPDAGALSGPGGYARSLLRPQPANQVTVQIIEQSGETPNQAALNAAVAMLRRLTGKQTASAGPVVFSSNTTQWSPDQMASVADAQGAANLTGTTTAVVHLLVLRGSFQGDQNVLGAAFRGDSFAIFPDQTTNGSLTLNSDRTVTAIYIHETGHLLGLVDEVLNDHRADPNDPSHCGCHSSDRNSVMYYALDTTAIGQLLSGGPPTDFDADDYNDLARLRAGA
jgi:hypothetical protein